MTPESALLRQITDYLALKGIWWMRTQPYNGRTESGHWMRSGRRGCADLLITPRFQVRGTYAFVAVLVWLELKSAKGKQTNHQKEFEYGVETAGHHYLIIRDFTELEAWLKEHGAIC